MRVKALRRALAKKRKENKFLATSLAHDYVREQNLQQCTRLEVVEAALRQVEKLETHLIITDNFVDTAVSSIALLPSSTLANKTAYRVGGHAPAARCCIGTTKSTGGTSSPHKRAERSHSSMFPYFFSFFVLELIARTES